MCNTATGFSARVNFEGQISETCQSFMVEFVSGYLKAKANRHDEAYLGRGQHVAEVFLWITLKRGLEILPVVGKPGRVLIGYFFLGTGLGFGYAIFLKRVG
jgi:hypothetical protein